MNLQPVRFNKAEELMSFIDRLNQSGYITLEKKDNQQRITSVAAQFNTLFLKTKDGSVYLLEDVQRFLNEASDADIVATKASFVIANKNKPVLPSLDNLLQNIEEVSGGDTESTRIHSALAEKDTTVTLAQIKADSTLYDRIERDTSLVSLVTQINLTIYSYTAFPFLKTVEDIRAAKKVFDNTKVHNGVISSISSLSIGQSLASLFSSLNKAIFTATIDFPLPRNVSELFNRLTLDTMKITLTQEAKLKAYLLAQRDVANNKQEIDELNKWITELDKNNAKTKELLQNIVTFLNNQCDNIKANQAKYNAFVNTP